MDVFVARQPIFNRNMHTVAYELLFRSGIENQSSFQDGDQATLTVLNATFLDLTGGKKAYINFTHNLITDEIPALFPRGSLVIELLEDIVPDAEFLTACHQLKAKGYEFALDDFISANAVPELINLANIIKVDFLSCDPEDRAKVIRQYRRPGLAFLAEKVETMEEFDEAVQLGYSLFQGYFFARPQILQSKDIKTFKAVHYRLMSELAKADPDFTILTQIIESDVSMTYKLLRVINSASLYPTSRITSVRTALVRLGHKEIKKWSALLMLQDLASDKPEALLRQSLVRAKMSENLSDAVALSHKRSELFLMGLLSLLDVIMNQPMQKLLQGLPIDPEIAVALTGGKNSIGKVLDLVKGYESANWLSLDEKSRELGLGRSDLTKQYCAAVQWADGLT